jgi:hypothetical protein
MDFTNRTVQSPVAPSSQPVNGGGVHVDRKHKSSSKEKWGRIGTVAAVLVVVILLIGVIGLIVSGNNVKSEDKYVDTNRLQAVFLNTGQVYFGNIKDYNRQYVILENIFYLQTSSTGSTTTASSTSNNVSLVKLGCELHQPYDQMIINTSQLTFWENLQPTGQVAQAVSTFEKDNPNGQTGSDQSSSSSSTTNSVQSAPSTSSATTPSTSTGTTSATP